MRACVHACVDACLFVLPSYNHLSQLLCPMRLHLHISVCIHASMNARVRTCVLACIHVYIYTDMQVCAGLNVHVDMDACACVLVCSVDGCGSCALSTGLRSVVPVSLSRPSSPPSTTPCTSSMYLRACVRTHVHGMGVRTRGSQPCHFGFDRPTRRGRPHPVGTSRA